MAIYHCSVKIISRSQGRSATGAAAYRAGEKIIDERTGLVHDYRRKSGVDHVEILTPSNAPDWTHERSRLWNQVERQERRSDSQLCREVEVALPCELTPEQNLELVRGYVQSQFVDQGMIADVAIHHAQSANPHAHILLTMRAISHDGFGQKNRDWNKSEQLAHWREAWQERSNHALERAGHDTRIDHRTLEAQGVERLPQIHLGAKVVEMEKRGIRTERGKMALAIDTANSNIIKLQDYRESLDREYHRTLEKREDTRAAGAADRTHGTSLGDSGRDRERADSTATRRDDGADASLGSSAGQYRGAMATSGQDLAQRRARADEHDQPVVEPDSVPRVATAADLCAEFDHGYSDALARIVDLARPTTGDSKRSGVAPAQEHVLKRTYNTISKQLKAMGCQLYEIGIKTANRFLVHKWSLPQVLDQIPWLRRENARGAQICVRPSEKAQQEVTLVDGVNRAQIASMTRYGLEPAAIVQTSVERHQVWLKLTDQPIDQRMLDGIAQSIGKRFNAENITNTEQWGLLAGFANRDPQFQTKQGRNPIVECHQATGQQTSKGQELIDNLKQAFLEREAQIESQRRLKTIQKAPRRASKSNLMKGTAKNLKRISRL